MAKLVRLREWAVAGVLATTALLACVNLACAAEAAKPPAVLFTSGLHQAYFTKPLHAEGIELHTCSPAQLPERLPTGDYNAAVVTGGLADAKVVEALNAFMAAGGGVLLLPGEKWREAEWLAHQKFLEGHGARFDWVIIHERDPGRVVQAFQCPLQFTESVSPPFNDDVSGLLYYHRGNQEGSTAPVSVSGDANWMPVVKASPTAEAVPYEAEKRAIVRPYIPARSELAPTLLAARQVGKGRLAAVGINPEWIFASPGNCPPVEDMMTRGQGGKPSDWIRLYANLFRWLGEPTLAAGKGGKPTPAALLESTFKPKPPEVLRDWTQAPPILDQDQLPGLVGARSNHSGGKATVAEWVAAAKAAGLRYLVFLEPLAGTTEESFTKLKADCQRTNDVDATFFACPGIWWRDAHTRTAQFFFGENVQYPLATIPLTADRAMFDNSKGLPEQVRTKYIFDYVFEQMGYKGPTGYFRHDESEIPPWEYKMNNMFVIHSTENGKTLDNHFDDFAFLQAQQMYYAPLSIALMDSPDQIAATLRDGWTVVNTAPGEFGDGSYSKEYGEGVAAMRKLFTEELAWLRPYQYITQGPRLLAWRGRWEVVVPWGEWFRPDLWRYQARLHVVSEAGLKDIAILSNGRELYHFRPGGAKEFDRTFEFENSQQRSIYPIVTDVNGRQAIGSYIRNTNTLQNEFICGDRCNYLSSGTSLTKDGRYHFYKSGNMNGYTHNKGGWYGTVAPSATLTLDYPTLPIDGAGSGKDSPSFVFAPAVAVADYPPISHINCRPRFVLAGPDVVIGGGYVDNVITDPSSWGNAWSWWSPVKPNPFVEGFGQVTSFAAYSDGLRAGWYEFQLAARQDLGGADAKMPVRYTHTRFTEFRDAGGAVYTAADLAKMPESGPFGVGAYLLVDAEGGPAGLVSLDDGLVYTRKGNEISLGARPAAGGLAAGAKLATRIGFVGSPAGTSLDTLRAFFAAMQALPPESKIQAASQRADAIALHLDGAGRGAEVKIPAVPLRANRALLLEGMNDTWDVWLLDRARPAPNWRQLPMVDGTAYAAVFADEAIDLFLGHPVIADRPELRISLCNTLPGKWLVSIHNPTERAITARVESAKAWTPFTLPARSCEIAAGSSLDLAVEAAQP
ncbi:MAG: hypothetical protein BWZ02_00302 [Lentisphaerae bacterium ADurb.BinA184]|nr:MAG: hypothetical protein BWZ02_00302 [Lentisphaerae bacterium ADurb.BinA184]